MRAEAGPAAGVAGTAVSCAHWAWHLLDAPWGFPGGSWCWVCQHLPLTWAHLSPEMLSRGPSSCQGHCCDHWLLPLSHGSQTLTLTGADFGSCWAFRAGARLQWHSEGLRDSGLWGDGVMRSSEAQEVLNSSSCPKRGHPCSWSGLHISQDGARDTAGTSSRRQILGLEVLE